MAQFLLITPPLTQLNTAYPATAQLQGFLRSRGVACHQADLSIEVVDQLLTADTLQKVFLMAEERFIDKGERPSKNLRVIISNSAFYTRWVEPVKRFLQGKDLTLQSRFANPNFWANTKRFPKEDDMEWDYGTAGTYNRAQLFATLFVEDLSILFQEVVSEHFEMVRYGEKLCMSLSDFTPLYDELHTAPNLIDTLTCHLLDQYLATYPETTHLGLAVPFPGNLYAALRCAQHVRKHYPHLRIVMGGGYVNTELRQITDTRLFEYIDYLIFDDGELPLLRLAEGGELVRTITCEDGQLVVHQLDSNVQIPFKEIATPSLEGLPLADHLSAKGILYMDTADTANPMQRLWANGRWLKMMMAHGCYWHKCSFCDTCLDYIGRYDAAPAEMVVERMEEMYRESGLTGFHFVDEAMPPMVLKRVAETLIARGDTFSYWGNIRFEKVYTQELCYLLAQSGCVAVSGGIEVASERVLKLINKGVSVASVRETLRHFRDNGIMVHAYLMYGFPTETEKELYESLDIVRSLFEEGLIQSAFWHRYAMTCHSPSGRQPQSVGAQWAEPTADGLTPQFAPFANNEIPFVCPNAPDWTRFSRGLNVATFNYMRGTGFDVPIKKWFQ